MWEFTYTFYASCLAVCAKRCSFVGNPSVPLRTTLVGRVEGRSEDNGISIMRTRDYLCFDQ